jgi:hypothetical protein
LGFDKIYDEIKVAALQNLYKQKDTHLRMVKEAKNSSNTVKTPRKKRMSVSEREELLIENFIGLQKAMIHLSMKFENLSDNISKLLNVFELSAKDYLMTKKPGTESDKDLLNKINSLLEQNKTIAKGLVTIEEKVRNKTGDFVPEQVQRQPLPQLPQFPPSKPRIVDQI